MVRKRGSICPRNPEISKFVNPQACNDQAPMTNDWAIALPRPNGARYDSPGPGGRSRFMVRPALTRLAAQASFFRKAGEWCSGKAQRLRAAERKVQALQGRDIVTVAAFGQTVGECSNRNPWQCSSPHVLGDLPSSVKQSRCGMAVGFLPC